MDLAFAGETLSPAPCMRGRASIDQLPDTQARRSQHRRAQSDTLLRIPDLDDMVLDEFMEDLNLDLPPTPQSLSLVGHPPLSQSDRSSLFRSLSMDSDALGLDGQPAAAEVRSGTRHRHSNSMDGYSSTTSLEGDSIGKKAAAAERIAELALLDPKRAKRILANRQSAARSKERKVRYTSELERKVQTLQTEATTLSAQITLLQRDTGVLTAENKELKYKLQAMEQQAHLKDALNEALRNEVQRLKVTAAQIRPANGFDRNA